MSIEAMKWAMEQTIVTNPTDRHVLLIMANPAWKDGSNSFQSIASICASTGLSRRTVQMSIQRLVDVGAIRAGDRAVMEANIKRADMRPNVYDLCLERGAADAPRKVTGCISRRNGAHLTTERGAADAPDPNITPTDPIGVCDAHEPESIRPEVAACIELRKLGLGITPQHPDLIAAIGEGVTPQALVDMASLYPDKPAGYVIAACRRQHAERARPSPAARASPQAPSRTLQAIQILEEMKHDQDTDRDEQLRLVAH